MALEDLSSAWWWLGLLLSTLNGLACASAGLHMFGRGARLLLGVLECSGRFLAHDASTPLLLLRTWPLKFALGSTRIEKGKSD